ncbi:hypothetical protein CDEF62S_04363 [Castellaniella defragrans]
MESDDDPGSRTLSLLERHATAIGSLTAGMRDTSMDVLVIRAVVYGLMRHAEASGLDLASACSAIRDQLPEEHRASFTARLKAMYGIDLTA